MDGFKQSKTHLNAEFHINRMPDINETEAAIDKIYSDIQNGPIEELKSKEIADAFMAAKNQEFEINVVATMSSGKSTLINAMLSHELMPSANEPTTSTIVRIVADNTAKTFNAKAYNIDNKMVNNVTNVTLEQMQKMNKNDNISRIVMSGPIPFVSSSGMKLVLVDTPGPNNSKEKSHEEMTYHMISGSKKSMVLFVLNAEQIGINDEKILLDYVYKCMKNGGKQSRDRFLFVVNKINCFDPQPKHDGPGCIRKVLTNIKKDLEDRGIRNPNIFPVAALPALQLREADRFATYLNNFKTFSDAFEEMRFEQYNDFSNLPASVQSTIVDLKKKASPEELLEIRTGIITLEQAINLYVKKYARTTKIIDLVLAFNNKLEELATDAKLREIIRNDQNAKVEIEKQIEEIRKNIKAARDAKTFSNNVDALNLAESTKKEVSLLFYEIRSKLYRIMADCNTKVEITQAEQQCRELEKECNSLLTQMKVQIEKIIVDTFNNTVEKIITEYKKYLNNLNMGSYADQLRLNPLKMVQQDLGQLDIAQIMNKNKEVVDESSVKTEKYTETTGFSKDTNIVASSLTGGVFGLGAAAIIGTFFSPAFVIAPLLGIAFGAHSGAKEGDTRKTEQKQRQIKIPKHTTYIDMKSVAKEFFNPVKNEMDAIEKSMFEYIEKETTEIKVLIDQKLEELDNLLDTKLQDLTQYENDVKEKNYNIAELQKRLEWLEDIENRVNSIVNY